MNYASRVRRRRHYRVMNVCDNADVQHPTIITECGCAMVPYSLLLFDGGRLERRQPLPSENLAGQQLDEEVPQPIFDLLDAYRSVSGLAGAVLSRRHTRRGMCTCSPSANVAPLRGLASLFWATCAKPARPTSRGDARAETLRTCRHLLRNSGLPFGAHSGAAPGLPGDADPSPRRGAHSLRRARRHHLRLDGKLDIFPDPKVMKKTLELHPYQISGLLPRRLLVGAAYQETLGDLHPLGDTVVTKVDGRPLVDRRVVEGTSAWVLSLPVHPEEFSTACSVREAAVRRAHDDQREPVAALPRSHRAQCTYLEAEESYGSRECDAAWAAPAWPLLRRKRRATTVKWSSAPEVEADGTLDPLSEIPASRPRWMSRSVW